MRLWNNKYFDTLCSSFTLANFYRNRQKALIRINSTVSRVVCHLFLNVSKRLHIELNMKYKQFKWSKSVWNFECSTEYILPWQEVACAHFDYSHTLSSQVISLYVVIVLTAAVMLINIHFGLRLFVIPFCTPLRLLVVCTPVKYQNDT